MRVRFGECLFDSDTRTLSRGDRPLRLTPKAFQLLELLLQERPKAIAKERILDHLWPDVAVSDASLPNLVTEIRTALGDDARSPRFVRTHHRFGYAFCGTATEAPPEPAGRVPRVSCRLLWGPREFGLAEGESLIGRSSECAVCIDSPKVSRQHARIVVASASATLEDLGSKNGTWVRGERCEAPTALADGDEVAFGEIRMTFLTAADPSTESLELRPGRPGSGTS